MSLIDALNSLDSQRVRAPVPTIKPKKRDEGDLIDSPRNRTESLMELTRVLTNPDYFSRTNSYLASIEEKYQNSMEYSNRAAFKSYWDRVASVTTPYSISNEYPLGDQLIVQWVNDAKALGCSQLLTAIDLQNFGFSQSKYTSATHNIADINRFRLMSILNFPSSLGVLMGNPGRLRKMAEATSWNTVEVVEKAGDSNADMFLACLPLMDIEWDKTALMFVGGDSDFAPMLSLLAYKKAKSVAVLAADNLVGSTLLNINRVTFLPFHSRVVVS